RAHTVCLFVYSYRDRPDLHSVPTRRSSDLAVPVLRELAAALDEFGLRQRKCALRPVQLGRERLEARLLRMPRPESIAALKAQALDRKSTRLNSSHVKISYAVFCLKKKKKTN